MRFLVCPKGFAKPRPRNAPPGRFCPAGRKSRGTGCSNPLFYCSIKSMQNKKSSTPQGAALGATGRIRTSGLPGRRTTTGQYRLALKREFRWFCTVADETRKSPLLVVTTGFFGILRCRCTVVVKWWSTADRQKFRQPRCGHLLCRPSGGGSRHRNGSPYRKRHKRKPA